MVGKKLTLNLVQSKDIPAGKILTVGNFTTVMCSECSMVPIFVENFWWQTELTKEEPCQMSLVFLKQPIISLRKLKS